MIPSESIDVALSSADSSEVSKTYKILDYRIQGYIDGMEALEQAIYKMLNTEKYEYPIYSFLYGIELESLIGQDSLYVQMELMRRIEECLLTDERIQSVENFEFTISSDTILCSCKVNSIYGTSTIYKEVNI